jgi:hypothetical protein
MPDRELEAMAKIQDALVGLDPNEIKRVISWVSDRHNVEGGSISRTASLPTSLDFATFFSQISPSSGAERVLAAGYWLQEKEGKSDVTGYEVNKKIRELGHAVSNVTDAFNSLMSGKPQLAIQVAKSGTTKQAKKRYRITVEGVNRIKKMILKDNGSSTTL